MLLAGEEGEGRAGGYSFPSDVFSLAMVLWELMQPFSPRLANPFVGLDAGAAAERMGEGLRPPFGEVHEEEMRDFLVGAWATLPEDRPTCQRLLERARKLGWD